MEQELESHQTGGLPKLSFARDPKCRVESSSWGEWSWMRCKGLHFWSLNVVMRQVVACSVHYRALTLVWNLLRVEMVLQYMTRNGNEPMSVYEEQSTIGESVSGWKEKQNWFLEHENLRPCRVGCSNCMIVSNSVAVCHKHLGTMLRTSLLGLVSAGWFEHWVMMRC